MTCPDCGYLMTAFDKECPRCRNMGKPQKSCLKCGTTDIQAALLCRRCGHRFGELVEATPTETPSDQPSRASQQQEPSTIPPILPDLIAPPPRRFGRWQVIGLIALFLVTGSVVIGIGSAIQSDQRQQQAKTDDEQNKALGVGQCIAGDNEGCHYYMDKLRDVNAVEDAEFLKAHLLVGIALRDRQNVYRGNNGATSAEYTEDAEYIDDFSHLLAVEGDDNYRLYGNAADAATFLAQYGSSHHLTGRY